MKKYFCPAAGFAMAMILLLKAFTLLQAAQPRMSLPGLELPALLLREVLRFSPFG